MGAVTLHDLGLKHGTDKAGHGYLPVYEEVLAPWRNSLAPVMELGVQTGASLRMWEEWFPLAPVYGVDLYPVGYAGRAQVLQGDAGDVKFLDELKRLGPFGVIIDDAGHFGDQQEASFRALFPRLESGGVYAVEDLHAAYLPAYQPSGMPFLKSLMDAVNGHGFREARIARVALWPSLFVAWRA